jgi:hypothetical protein
MLAAWWGPSLASHPFNTILVSTDSAWPKTDYIKDPSGDFWIGWRRNTKIHQTDLQIVRIRGEVLSEPLPVAHSNPSTPSPSTTWWRGSSSHHGLWDCGSNLYQTLSRASLIRVTWVAYHDCDHICITPMVDLMLVGWFMRWKDIYVLDVWVDVYVTLFLCSCSDQTSMLVRVGGMCVLVGAIL